jgi:hypothetical protein
MLLALFALALLWAQFRESGAPALHARLELAIDPVMPARVYLFKDNQPFRLSPIQAVMPLHVDRFYRERLWINTPSPDTLEVTCAEQSHFFFSKDAEFSTFHRVIIEWKPTAVCSTHPPAPSSTCVPGKRAA